MRRSSYSIEPGLRDLASALKSERMLLHNLVVGGGTIVAGLLGVAFQSIASHQLRPADYGSVFAVVTLITFTTLPASAFTLLMARETSRARASGHYAASVALLRRGNRALMLCGLAVACLIGLSSPELGHFLDVPVELLLAACVGIPFGFALPLLLGEFQGEQRFTAFSLLISGQAGLKLAAAIGLGLVFGTLGVIAGISLATIIVYLIALRSLRRKLSIKANLSWWQPAARYLLVVIPSTLSLAVLLTADVLLVKHFFATREAGEYAVIAAVGRSIFWGATGVATVLFPKVVHRLAKGQSGLQIAIASLSIVATAGFAALGVLSFGSRWLLTAFAGPAYTGLAGLLPWYAVGMILLGGTAVLIALHQTRGEPGFLAVLIPLSLLEPALLLILHQSLVQVVQVVDVSMALLVAGLGTLYVVQLRATTTTALVDPTVASPKMAQVG